MAAAFRISYFGIFLVAIASWMPARAFAADPPTPQWIWSSGESADAVVFLRGHVDTTGLTVKSARLVVAADEKATVFVNGTSVLKNENWGSPSSADVLKLLKPGKNVVAIRAANSDGPAGVVAQLTLDTTAGPQVLVSNADWKATSKTDGKWQEVEFDDSAWPAAVALNALGTEPRGKVNAEVFARLSKVLPPEATPVEKLVVKKDFQVELLYSVPKDVEGSWVNLCVDPKGRLIVCDQYGGLFRLTPPPLGVTEAPKIEPINVDIGEAQGLLWAFDSLYVVVNASGKYESGVYRVRDTNGDDQLDSLETLRKLEGGGEHGPHAVLLTPDGTGLYIVCGNNTKLTDTSSSLVPKTWSEDHLSPRMPDGRGFMRGVLGPGGAVYRIDPEGKDWTLVSVGFRNEFDAAINRNGDLFTYDADMEWDFNTPWYRPTRVCHVVSGSEWGWRNGAGKYPVYYTETLPPVVDIGPGSPTGIVFGYGAKFPARYQDALYISDWSYGKLYAVHLQPEGGSYTAQIEEFVAGTPLPLTDVIIRPQDGAMYFTIGGRRTQSGLYRVTYAGSESTASVTDIAPLTAEHQLRRNVETLHGQVGPDVIVKAWPALSHEDRFIRSAARVALEHQPAESFRDRALAETNPQAAITALLALIRVSAKDEFHRQPEDPAVDPQLTADVLAALGKLSWNDLTTSQRVELLRTYQIAFTRLGIPTGEMRDALVTRFDAVFPAESKEENILLSDLLVALQAPSAAEKGVALLESAPTQEEQIDLARSLRTLKAGWTPELRQRYFRWFLKAGTFHGGNSFTGFMDNVKNDALALLTDEEKLALKPILEAPAASAQEIAPPRPFVKDWAFDEVLPLVENGMRGRDFERGKAMFAAVNCFSCHRFDNRGGANGPDLTNVAGRFSARDLLESTVDPSKVISDQYAAVIVTTVNGQVITGRIVNLNGDTIMINTNMLEPNTITSVERNNIDEMITSNVSMMPKGLLNTLNQDELLDLMAYLLSRGDRKHPAFK